MNLAPNGKPSNLTPEQYRLVRTSAFKKWFGDWERSPKTASKVVDENGEPLVVHHSYIQKKNKFKPFNVFKTKLTYEIGTHFGSKEQADTNITFKVRDRGYDRDAWETKTYECFLNIRKIRRLNDRRHWLPKTIFGNLYPRKKIDWFDFEKGKENIELFLKEIKGKVDGLIYNNDFEHGGDSYIVFEPNQIKLADGTNTTFDGSNPDIRYADGGGLSKTPAPKSERIYGSKTNKPKSSASSSSAKSINFSEDTLQKIKNNIAKHNENYPNKKITLPVAKAVVRRGMGAYSSTHRPTISGGKPNSRVAWGLARLNAFIHKAIHGTSKSGKYSQDDDLFQDLKISVKSYKDGGIIESWQYSIGGL